jgi:hypothetical protein
MLRGGPAPASNDPNLVSDAGLVPAMRLADLVGLEELLPVKRTINKLHAGLW